MLRSFSIKKKLDAIRDCGNSSIKMVYAYLGASKRSLEQRET